MLIIAQKRQKVQQVDVKYYLTVNLTNFIINWKERTK